MENSGYDISLIRRYLNGELDATAMYNLEREAQEDPLLWDLIEGMSGSETDHQEAIADIWERIDRRTESKEQSRVFPWRNLSIAASFLIMVGIASFFMLQDRSDNKSAKTTTELPNNSTLENAIIRSQDDTLSIANRDAASSSEKGVAIKKLPSEISGKDAPDESTFTEKNSLSEKKELLATNTNSALTRRRKQSFRATDTNSDGLQHTYNLDEVVVVSYETLNKATVAQSLASVKLDTFQNQLAGRVSGVQIRGSSSRRNTALEEFVTGIVRDAIDKKPVIGASVRIKGQNIGTTTGIDGRFTIAVPKRNSTLEVHYLGYTMAVVETKGKDTLTIALEPAMNALNEVVAVGYGKPKSGSANHSGPARPANGWPAFKKYLNKEAVAESESDRGTVVVSFNIAPTGVISDTRIVKGINKEIDQKAMNLIVEGPSWIGDEDGTIKKIKLRIRFR